MENEGEIIVLISTWISTGLVPWLGEQMCQLTKSFRLLPSSGNFLNYLMKIIVLSRLHCSKSETLEIAYDMKNRFLVMYSLISPQTTEYKNNSYVHSKQI